MLLAVAALGAVAALVTLPVASSTSGRVGPGTVELRATAARSGGTRLELPPLGAVSARTHVAPIALEAGVERIDLDGLQTVLSFPDPQQRLEATVERDLRPLLRSLVVRSVLLAALAGGLAAALLPGRRLHHLPVGALGGALVVTVLLARSFLGERVRALQLAGVAVALAGVVAIGAGG